MKHILYNDTFEVIGGKQYLEGVGGYDGTNPDECNDIATVLPNMVEITYDKLKSLRDNSNLVPGQQYRIIDYITTTMQANTISAQHQFDIIVTADTNETLNEIARACLHEGDTYFSNAGAKLEAWQIWYCLDNDTERFAWATSEECIYTDDSLWFTRKGVALVDGVTYYLWYNEGFSADEGETAGYLATNEEYPSVGVECDLINIEESKIVVKNHTVIEQIGEAGKGVIYYMKDEHDNECSYDFKNIQFKRYKITSFTNPDIVNSDTMPLLYAQESSRGYGYEVDMDDYIYCYTFASNQTDDNEDLSVTQLCDCKLNKIEKHVLDNTVKISLNNNVFFYHVLPEYPLMMVIKNNYFMHGGHHNTFIGGFYGNNIQKYFRYNIGCVYCDNVVSNYVESNLTCTSFTINTLEESFNHNIIGTKCGGNKFGVSAKNNIIGSDCQTNDFGIIFQDNVISSGFYRNIFANNTGGNTFGSNFTFNNCAPYFINNTFGSDFKFNNCATYFTNNTFADNTMYNTFGCSFRGNKFGSKVGINTFGEQCINNTFGSNIVGNTCHSNTRNNIIGSNFTHNIGKFVYSTFGNNVHADVENGAFITACDFGNSSYFNLQVPSSASTENYVKNLKFCNINGTASEYVNITPPITNQDYELKVAKNSNGEIKIYCEADLIV